IAQEEFLAIVRRATARLSLRVDGVQRDLLSSPLAQVAKELIHLLFGVRNSGTIPENLRPSRSIPHGVFEPNEVRIGAESRTSGAIRLHFLTKRSASGHDLARQLRYDLLWNTKDAGHAHLGRFLGESTPIAICVLAPRMPIGKDLFLDVVGIH